MSAFEAATNGGSPGDTAAADRRFEGAAIDLAGRGYYVFPLCSRGKAPLTKQGFHNATRDERQILTWW